MEQKLTNLRRQNKLNMAFDFSICASAIIAFFHVMYNIIELTLTNYPIGVFNLYSAIGLIIVILYSFQRGKMGIDLIDILTNK